MVLFALGIIGAVFPMAVYSAVSVSAKAHIAQGVVKFFHITTIFYFVIFMPLIAFMLVLAVPFYVFKLQTVSNFLRIVLLALIVATLIFVALQFMWLNVNIDFVKQLYNYPAVWIFSWLVHVAIMILIISPLIYEEEPLFVALLISLVVIIVSANYVGYRYLILLKAAAKT